MSGLLLGMLPFDQVRRWVIESILTMLGWVLQTLPSKHDSVAERRLI